MPLVLGIDGGGSKTTCAVARERLVIGRCTTGPSNLVRASHDDVRRNLERAVKAACAEAGISPSELEAACASLGGAGREAIRQQAEQILCQILPCPIEVCGDMVAALDASAKGGPGLIIIAGTGSVAFGRNSHGDTARVGGWGPIVSDEGSGYWIGRRAVAECITAVDSARSTKLIEAILKCWRVATREELVIKANAQPLPNYAELFPIVLTCSHEGDSLAQELLVEAGAELAKLARIVARRLWPGERGGRIVLTGGVVENSAVVRQVLENSVRAERPDAEVSLATEQPVMGAIYRAELLAVGRLPGLRSA
jgi:N-acetylglucosamine kinase-like BadF-type ATPase